jgi:hypothetical protein
MMTSALPGFDRKTGKALLENPSSARQFRRQVLSMRKLLLLGLFALTSLSSAVQVQSIVGSYRYVPDDAVKEHCRKHKLTVPKGELILREDFTFSLAVNDHDGIQQTLGTYVVENDLVRFNVETGIGRDLPHVLRVGQRGLNGKGAAYSRVVVKSSSTTPVVRPPVAVVEPITPAPAPSGRIDGAWTAYRNGVEDRTIRMTFTPNGRFRFTGVGVSSAGEYRFDPESSIFTLTYREVDGQRLPDGGSFTKRVLLEEEGTSFTIEKCLYRRASGK